VSVSASVVTTDDGGLYREGIIVRGVDGMAGFKGGDLRPICFGTGSSKNEDLKC
jgi:hypothetical protein